MTEPTRAELAAANRIINTPDIEDSRRDKAIQTWRRSHGWRRDWAEALTILEDRRAADSARRAALEWLIWRTLSTDALMFRRLDRALAAIDTGPQQTTLGDSA